MGDIFDAIAEDYGCGGCGEIISPLMWKQCKLIDGKKYHPGCEPGREEDEKAIKGYTSSRIRRLADYGHSPGSFHGLVFEILADMMEVLEEIKDK